MMILLLLVSEPVVFLVVVSELKMEKYKITCSLACGFVWV
jgi:hypothetical protein